MVEFIGAAIAILVIVVLAYNWLTLLQDGIRVRFLQRYEFPRELLKELRKEYPKLRAKDFDLVAQALRQYFLAYKGCGYRLVAMPSRIVGDLWRLFSAEAARYGLFCQKAFGRYFPCTPALDRIEKDSEGEERLKRTWRWCCLLEGIYRNSPTRLPLLFAIDKKMKVNGSISFQLEKNISIKTSA